MNAQPAFPSLIAVAASLLLATPLLAGELKLLDFDASGAERQVKASYGSEEQVEAKIAAGAKGKALEVSVKPGPAGYPGVEIKAPQGAAAWDLSSCGHVESRVVNTGDKPLALNLRVDNDYRGDAWNCEKIDLKPGEAGSVSVIFGHSYGHKPGYALRPEAVGRILMFVTKTEVPLSWRVETLAAGGPAGEKPPWNPNTVRFKPKDGAMLGPGAAFDIAVEVDRNSKEWSVARPGEPLPDAALRIESRGDAKGSLEGQSVKIAFPAAGTAQDAVALKPSIGCWDLRDASEIRVKLKNDGKTPLAPCVQANSEGVGQTDAISSAAPLAPGAGLEIVVPFAPAIPGKGVSPGSKPGYYGVQDGTGTKFNSDAVNSIVISAKRDAEASLTVESVSACSPTAILPDWLGKRPPVEGDWVKTFDDEFDGDAIDQSKWAIYGPNYWDKVTHWSKDNVILGGGVVKLRYERKRGFHNDNPKIASGYNQSGKSESDYACGFLETYGKWAQRYGYFEARMKLPDAPGLWPAFWLMPDRGAEAGPQHIRQDTANGGMEFDVMEHLTRWGRHRYNIAWHWDGYGKEHKTAGSECNYVQPDKEGFITCGLLWLPGLTVYYCNGRELLRWEDSRVANTPCDMMFTVPAGGWENSSVDDAKLPADLVIDYVRVWQRKDLAPQP